MKVIFMGTPQFAVPCLEALIKSSHKVVGVVCQPDRKGNRNRLEQPPVKLVAKTYGLGVYQYDRVSRDGLDELKELNADIMVTAAYGQILSEDILRLTPKGVVNVHASLLPKYRGSAPIHYAIINGEKKTGVTIMQTEREVDSGDIILQGSIDIQDHETTGELSDRLSILGAKLLIRALDEIEKGIAKFISQDHTIATHYPMLSKSDGLINWNKNSKELKDFVRGMQPWPSAFTQYGDTTIKVIKVQAIDYCIGGQKVGEIVKADNKNGLIVKVRDGYLRLLKIQPQGKRIMKDTEFVLGARINTGEILC